MTVYVIQHYDMSLTGQHCMIHKAPGKLLLSCTLAVLRGVEEQSVLTGEATEKIGHCCQDMGEATEDLRRISQAGLKPHDCTSTTSQSGLKNVYKLPCNVNRWHLFAVRSLHLNSNVPRWSFSTQCVIHFL